MSRSRKPTSVNRYQSSHRFKISNVCYGLDACSIRRARTLYLSASVEIENRAVHVSSSLSLIVALVFTTEQHLQIMIQFAVLLPSNYSFCKLWSIEISACKIHLRYAKY